MVPRGFVQVAPSQFQIFMMAMSMIVRATMVVGLAAAIGLSVWNTVVLQTTTFTENTENVNNIYIEGGNSSISTCTPASDGDFLTFNVSGDCLAPVSLTPTIDGINDRIDELEIAANDSASCCAANAEAITILDEKVVLIENNITSLTVISGDVTIIQQQLTDLENTVTVLVTNVTNVEGRLDVVETSIVTLDSRVIVVENNISTAFGAIDSLDTRVNVVETNLSTAFGAIDSLDQRVDGIESNLTLFNDRLTTVEGDVSSLDARMLQAEADIVSLEYRMNATEVVLDEVEDRTTVNEADILFLTNRTNTLDSQMSSVFGSLVVINNDIDQLQLDSSFALGEITVLDQRTIATDNNVTTLNNEVSALEGLIWAIADNLTCSCTGNYSYSISVLQMEIDDANSAIVVLDNRVDTAETNIGLLTTRMNTAESDINSLESRMTVAEGDINSLESRMTIAEGEIDTLQSQYTSLDGRVDTVESDIIDLNNDVDSLSNRVNITEYQLSVVLPSPSPSGNFLRSTGTAWTSQTVSQGVAGGLLPAVGGSGNFLRSDGTNWATQTVSNGVVGGLLPAVGGSGNFLRSDGTNWGTQTVSQGTAGGLLPTAGSSGNFLRSDGTNWGTQTVSQGVVGGLLPEIPVAQTFLYSSDGTTWSTFRPTNFKGLGASTPQNVNAVTTAVAFVLNSYNNNNCVSLSNGNSRMTINNAGFYRIEFSAVAALTDSVVRTLRCWIYISFTDQVLEKGSWRIPVGSTVTIFLASEFQLTAASYVEIRCNTGGANGAWTLGDNEDNNSLTVLIRRIY